MEKGLPVALPDRHREFLDRAVKRLARHDWLVGVAASGSFAAGSMDAFSDFDLTLAVEEGAYASVLADRRLIAESLGPVLTLFTGEHVGEPRLLLCLYGPPLLHVDFLFTALADFARRVDEPVVLWERDGRLSAALQVCEPVSLLPDPQWMEDRFWVWVHKAGGKIGRGELFEAIEYLGFLRKRVLGPLYLGDTSGLRRLESSDPALALEFRATLAGHDAGECLAALRACVELYRRRRSRGVTHRLEAERAVLEFLGELESRVGGQ